MLIVKGNWVGYVTQGNYSVWMLMDARVSDKLNAHWMAMEYG